MEKGKLFFLIGLARSGKSTFARKWERLVIDIYDNNIIQNHIDNYDNPRVVICSDWIRLALHGQPFAQEAEGLVHELKMLMIRIYINNGYDVLIDGTHTTDKSIKDILRIDKFAQFYLCNTTAAECKKRAIMTNQEYLIERNVIDRMEKQLASWRDNAEEHVNKLRNEL